MQESKSVVQRREVVITFANTDRVKETVTVKSCLTNLFGELGLFEDLSLFWLSSLYEQPLYKICNSALVEHSMNTMSNFL